MLFTTASEWVALALTLLAGWLFGLASHPGGRKWRGRYATERDAHAAYRRDMEAKLSGSEARLREHDAERGRWTEREARLAELERDRAELDRTRSRVAELERENARLHTSHAAPVVGAAPAAAHPTTTQPAMPLTRRILGGERSRRGWFDWGPGADPRARRG